MTELFQRVYGTEVEYGAEELLHNRGNYDYQQLSRPHKLLDYLPAGIGIVKGNGMIGNGARYYVDYNQHIEYATAEHTSLWETVAAEIAGERIVGAGVERYAELHPDVKKAQLFKSVYEDGGTTWGYHFNVAADATQIPHPNLSNDEFQKKVYLLGLHLATYNLYAGGGTIYRDKGGYKFSLAQKALGLSCDFSSGTTSGKPLVNLRDEPHGPAEKMLRTHITSGDPNISPWASWMTLGTTSLVLRAIEQGRAKEEDILHLKHVGANRTLEPLSRLTATDLSFSKKVEFDNSKKQRTPLQIQKYIYKIVEKTYHTDEEAVVLKEWKRALEDLSEDPMRLEDRADAFAKLSIMRAYAKKKGVEFSDENYGDIASRFIDHNYSTLTFVDKSEGAKHPPLLSARARENRFEKWMSEDRIVDNIQNPPTTTRAHLRGNAIKNGNVMTAGWTSYKLNDLTEIKTLHPLQVSEDDERLAG